MPLGCESADALAAQPRGTRGLRAVRSEGRLRRQAERASDKGHARSTDSWPRRKGAHAASSCSRGRGGSRLAVRATAVQAGACCGEESRERHKGGTGEEHHVVRQRCPADRVLNPLTTTCAHWQHMAAFANNRPTRGRPAISGLPRLILPLASAMRYHRTRAHRALGMVEAARQESGKEYQDTPRRRAWTAWMGRFRPSGPERRLRWAAS